MKQYTILFPAFIYAGGFTDLDNAANGCSEGSGKAFTETHSEEIGDHVIFTDANGDAATIVPGDAITPVFNDDKTLKGYLAVDATVVATWSEVAAPATTSDTTGAGTDTTGADASNSDAVAS